MLGDFSGIGLGCHGCQVRAARRIHLVTQHPRAPLCESRNVHSGHYQQMESHAFPSYQYGCLEGDGRLSTGPA